MSRLGWLLCWLAVPIMTAHGQGARSLTVQVWSARTVKSLEVTPLDSGKHALQVEWTTAGLKTAASAAVQQLSLSGNYCLESGGMPVTAAGLWTIAWQPAGVRVLLTLSSERYVAAVLNAETAPDEPVASLKAMAITMRTFALANAGRHRVEGFDLCDSTHCQAMRFGRTRPEVQQAVEETAGETLWFEGRRAHVYYTQNCGGHREAATDVWPAERVPYLAGHRDDPYCVRRSRANWQARIPLAELSRIFAAQGWRTPASITSVLVTRRSASGRAELLSIAGSGEPAVLSASSFRFAVDRALGWNQVRSDWYSTRVTGADLAIAGRGYGHGVGLCQAGAYQMAVEGHSDSAILQFYFPGVVGGVTPMDGGWQRAAGVGWTLLTIGSPGSLLAEGNAAWAKAQALLGETGSGAVVEELPNTELFRETANQPGWVLAATRGSTVLLQPRSVRANNGGTEALLLHEFLHVLVERQAGLHAPLWLREGLVETLAAPRRKGQFDLTEDEVESALAHPKDAAASQHAHEVAAVMAQRLCDRYGLPAVKGFLRTGLLQ